ncbi:large ribosomal subunit protein eL28 isoform X1 [Symphalangus syndactylus]|uniref:large ribosomal subunit protein eL28 isoform X1 n=1 Tax=Symphalangus syndactylus TaxID=9590 RepID=UPI00244298EB|nr:60S ribosomal protein L28 isoform X1 [Symphalangus syndactylus]
MSAHLQWMVVRNCSSFLIKRNKQTYSTEPNNLKARNSFRYNGLIHRKTVGVEPAADGKGVVVVIKRRSGQRKPATSYVRTTINKNARATLSSIRHMIRKNKYRPDLRMDMLASTVSGLRCSVAVQPWATSSTSLCLRTLICNMCVSRPTQG